MTGIWFSACQTSQARFTGVYLKLWAYFTTFDLVPVKFLANSTSSEFIVSQVACTCNVEISGLSTGDCVKKKVIDKLFVNEVLSKEVNSEDS